MDGPLSGRAWRSRESERTQRRDVQYPLGRGRERGRDRTDKLRQGEGGGGGGRERTEPGEGRDKLREGGERREREERKTEKGGECML